MTHERSSTATPKKKHVAPVVWVLTGMSTFFAAGFFVVPFLFPILYTSTQATEYALVQKATTTISVEDEAREPEPLRLKPPESLKAIYMTQCVAGTPSFRADLIELAEKTEINAIIIDAKDFSGGLGFKPQSPELKPYLSENCYASDMKELVRTINEKGIYAIARVTVFQDPMFATDRPDIAVQKASDRSIWSDYKGLHFIDVGSQEAWDRILLISHELYDIGFDEINYDYIRFPSDGNMQDIYFPLSEEALLADAQYGKAEILEEFFMYLHNGLQDIDVKTSADLFGMVTTNTDDLNIGQQLERTLPYFDYVAPMVYPSHYPKGFNGWSNPNDHVYEIIAFSMGRGVERTVATTTTVATLHRATPLSTTTPYVYPKEGYPATKLRPWLQDFDYGGNYDIAEVRAQIQATYDVGLTSWMLWDPANRYTRDALLPATTTSLD